MVLMSAPKPQHSIIGEVQPIPRDSYDENFSAPCESTKQEKNFARSALAVLWLLM